MTTRIRLAPGPATWWTQLTAVERGQIVTRAYHEQQTSVPPTPAQLQEDPDPSTTVSRDPISLTASSVGERMAALMEQLTQARAHASQTQAALEASEMPFPVIRTQQILSRAQARHDAADARLNAAVQACPRGMRERDDGQALVEPDELRRARAARNRARRALHRAQHEDQDARRTFWHEWRAHDASMSSVRAVENDLMASYSSLIPPEERGNGDADRILHKLKSRWDALRAQYGAEEGARRFAGWLNAQHAALHLAGAL